MDVFTTGNTALKIIRTVRKGCALALAQTTVQEISPITERYLTLPKIGMPALCNALRIPWDEPLHILVPSARSRRRCQGVTCSVRSSSRGEGSFLEVVPKDGMDAKGLLPDAGHLYVESPASLVVTMGTKLTALFRKGACEKERAALMLLKLCLELCGTFTHDACAPHGEAAAFGVPPVLTKDELSRFSGSLKRTPGLSLVREALPNVFDRSGSPQESFVGTALFASPSYGGLRLGECLANTALDLSPAQRRSLVERRITPDFQMPEYHIAVEVNGAVHHEGANPQKDHVRTLDYQTLTWLEFVFENDDVKTQQRFNQSASRIVAAIEQFEGPSARRRFERLVRDPAFYQRQRALFEVFRPWMRQPTAPQATTPAGLA